MSYSSCCDADTDLITAECNVDMKMQVAGLKSRHQFVFNSSCLCDSCVGASRQVEHSESVQHKVAVTVGSPSKSAGARSS